MIYNINNIRLHLYFSQNELRPYVGSYIKSVRPCTDLISCFADDKTWILFRTTTIHGGSEGKNIF